MNHWEQALEQEAKRLAIMRALHFTVAARNIRRAVALGVLSRHEAELVLAGVGYDGADVKRVLGEEPTFSLDALKQALALDLMRGPVEGAKTMYARKALGFTRGELAIALGYADEAVERWEDGSDDVPADVVDGLLGMLEHATADGSDGQGWSRPDAEEFRALLDRMATWGEANAETHEEALARHDASDHACDVTFIRQVLEAGSDAAEAIHWPEFFARRKRLGAAAEAIEAPARETIRWMEQDREMGAEGVAFLFAPPEQPKATFRLRSPDEVYEIAMRHSARIKAGEDGGRIHERHDGERQDGPGAVDARERGVRHRPPRRRGDGSVSWGGGGGATAGQGVLDQGDGVGRSRPDAAYCAQRGVESASAGGEATLHRRVRRHR